MIETPRGTRVRINDNARSRFAAGRLGTVSTCPDPEAWRGSEADDYPVVVDLDPWNPGDAPDRDFHFSDDELTILGETP